MYTGTSSRKYKPQYTGICSVNSSPPGVLYRSELWSDFIQKDVKALNAFQHFVCKHAMNLPKPTRLDMREAVFGLLPKAF